MRAIKHRKGTYFREIKKIRGGKRHLQRLRYESTWAPELDEEALRNYQYNYERLGLHPWHWHHRQPPLQVRQLAVQHLLTTFFAWQKQLAELPDPYFLAIRIVAPELAHSSEVMVAVKNQHERYHARYNAPDPAGPSLPEVYQKLPGAEKLTWHTQLWEIFVDAFDYPKGWPVWALQKLHYTWHSVDGSEYLIVQTGWMWVGQLSPRSAVQLTP